MLDLQIAAFFQAVELFYKFFYFGDLVDFILSWLNLCHKVACQVGIRAGYGLPGAKARARQRDKFTPFYLRLNLLFAFCTLKLACRFMP